MWQGFAAVRNSLQDLSDLTTTYFSHYTCMWVAGWPHVDSILPWGSRRMNSCYLMVLAPGWRKQGTTGPHSQDHTSANAAFTQPWEWTPPKFCTIGISLCFPLFSPRGRGKRDWWSVCTLLKLSPRVTCYLYSHFIEKVGRIPESGDWS